MASIYESRGPQVQLTGPQTGPSFQAEQSYDPTRIMAAQSEKDLASFANFSETLNKFLIGRAEEQKKNQIASGFTKFVTGQVTLNPETVQKQKEQTTLLKSEADRASGIANEAEQTPGMAGMAATVRTQSPALRGFEAVGAAIAAAQGAPVSLGNYINQARAENRVIQDPETGGTIQLRPDMGRVEAERAMQILTGMWGKDTGYNTISPNIMMEHAGGNLAIMRSRLMEEWGKELDENTKENLRIKNEVNGIKILDGVIDQGTAQSASNALEQGLVGGTKERNETFKSTLTKSVTQKLAAGDGAGAYALLTNLGNVNHPSGVGTYRTYHSDVFQALDGEVSKAGQAKSEAITKERLGQFTIEAQQADKLPVAQRKEIFDNPTTGIKARMRAAGIDEENINKLSTGGSTSFEIALLKGAKDGSIFRGKGRLTKQIVAVYKAEGTIDANVASQLENSPGIPDGDDTVEKAFKAAKDHASGLVAQWQTSSFTAGQVPTATQTTQASRTRDAAMTIAMEKYKPKMERWLESGQPINPTRVAEELAALARTELNTQGKPYYWDPVAKQAPNINQLTNKAPNLNETFDTLLPKSTVDAVTKRISGLAMPIGPATSFGLTADAIQAAQQAVNTGGPIPTYIKNIAKFAGYTDPNALLSKEASGMGMTWTPNKDQQTFYLNAKSVSPAIADKLRSDLTPTDRRYWISRLQAAKEAQQLRTQTQPSSPGGTYSTFQNDLVNKESGGDYGQYNFGYARSGPGDAAMTTLKVRDIVRGDYRINGQQVVHFGAYQFKAATFAAVAKAAGISLDAPFNKETQDKAFRAVVMDGALPWRNSLNDYVAGRVPDNERNLANAIGDLRNEWTSMNKLTPAKLGQYLRGIRSEKTMPLDPNLSTTPARTRSVEVGKALLNMGGKIWQHPNFDLRKGYIASGGGVVGTNRSAQSLHHQAQALDLPLSDNSPTTLDNIYDYLLSNSKALGISEIYWDRKGYYQNGKMIGGPRSKAIADHDTHLHVSFN